MTSLAIILAVVGTGLAHQGTNLTARRDPQPQSPEESLRLVAQNAEVHAVGVGGPLIAKLRQEDVKDLSGLVDALRRRKGPAARVWELLPEKIQKILAADDIMQRVYDFEGIPLVGRPPAPEVLTLKGGLPFEFTKILDRADFYAEEAFKGVDLDKEAKDLLALGEKRTAYQTARLNWLLLRAAFPTSIREIPPTFRTVRVKVAKGKDVVLVLSSYLGCRWEVEVEKGGKVVGVLLCGSDPQEVAGVDDVPLVYRAYYGPDGKRVIRPGYKSFGGYDGKSDNWKKFVEGVKEVAGKEFDTFQGGERPGPKDEPYVIRPAAK